MSDYCSNPRYISYDLFEGVNNSLHYPPFRELRKGGRWGVEAELSEGVSEGLSEGVPEGLSEGVPETCVQLVILYFLGMILGSLLRRVLGGRLGEGFEGFWEGFALFLRYHQRPE